MAVFRPSQEVTDLVRALGLDPKKVTALNLRIRPNELVTVTVRQFVESEPGKLAEVVGRFDLVPKSELLRLSVRSGPGQPT